MDAMQAIRETFFQECEEQLGELETGLLSMEAGNADNETVNAVFRAVHSIKGGAGAFKLDRLVRFAHAFETTLDKIRNGALAPAPHVLKVMLRAADVLADLVKVAQNGGEYDETHANELLAELNALQSGGPPAEAVNPLAGDETPNPFEAMGFTPVALSIEDEAVAAPPPAPSFEYTIEFHPKPDLYYKGNETSRLTRELARLGEIEVHCHTGEIPTLSDLDPEAVYLSWTIKLETSEDEAAVRSVFEFVDGDCDLSIAVSEPGAAARGPRRAHAGGSARCAEFADGRQRVRCEASVRSGARTKARGRIRQGNPQDRGRQERSGRQREFAAGHDPRRSRTRRPAH